MSDPHIGEVRMFGGNFAPRDWFFCHGQLLPISQYSTLFTLIGTTYGGDGQNTFALPDLRGRAPVHQGQGSGLTSRTIGEAGGAERVTLSVQQIPQHTHNVAYGDAGNQASPQGGLFGTTSARDFRYTTAAATVSLQTDAQMASGSSQSHENRSPYLALNFIICANGLFPSRN